MQNPIQLPNKQKPRKLPYSIPKRVSTQYQNHIAYNKEKLLQMHKQISQQIGNFDYIQKQGSIEMEKQITNSRSNTNSNSNIFMIDRATPFEMPYEKSRSNKHVLRLKSKSKELIKQRSKSKSINKEKQKQKQMQKLPQIPNFYLQHRDKSRRAKSTYQYMNNDITISYTKDPTQNLSQKAKINTILQNNQNSNKSITNSNSSPSSYQKFRQQIRKALSIKINFQHIQANHGKFLSQQFINKIKQPIKAITYNTQKFQFLYNNIKQIFGQDFQIANKDIIAAYGHITQAYYIFFTTVYYQPTSLCCNSLVYLKVEDDGINPFNRYAKKQINFNHNQVKSGNGDGKNNMNSTVTKFICSKCNKPVLIVRCKSSKFVQQTKIIGKQTLQLQAQRQKISMSICVASGRFKRMRIDQVSQKDITINLDGNSRINGNNGNDGNNGNNNKANFRYKPEDLMLKHRSRTLFLKNIGSRQIL